MSTVEPLWYLIDRDECIRMVNTTWAAFALANGGPQLLPPAILGRSLWDFIGDDATRQIYRALLSSIRQRAGAAHFRLRCDSPDERRLLQMQITATGEGTIMFTSRLVHVQPRTTVPLLDAAQARSEERIPVCAWCMRVRTSEKTWLAVEDAMDALGLFEAPSLPQLSYMICPACRVTARFLLADPPAAASGQVVFGDLEPIKPVR